MRICTILLLINFCFTQASGLALYGVGEKIGNIDVSSIALGNSTFFSGNKYGITTSSPSSLWKSALTQFTIHSGINYLNISSFPQQFQHNLTHFSLTFPVGNKKVFGFGLKPAFRTNKLEIEEDLQYIGADKSITGHPIAYKNSYMIDGGISKMFLQYSSTINTRFSFGIQYSFLFGNQSNYENRYIYDVIIDSTDSGGTVISEFENGDNIFYVFAVNDEMEQVAKQHQFYSSEFLMEVRYSMPSYEYVLRTTLSGNTEIDTKQIQNISNLISSYNFNSSATAKISELALGYHYKVANNSGVILESQFHAPFNIPEEVALFNTIPPYEYSIHLGTYYLVENPKYGYWNNLNLRVGGYLKQFDFTYEKYIDYGFTFGLGFEYLTNTQAVNLTLCAGKRESSIIKGQYEDYINIYFGITAGEKWFMKRRRK